MDTGRNKLLYDKWSATYDTVENPTRDLEREACRTVLKNVSLGHVIEVGCGTGKNTDWLSKKAASVLAIDLSPEMQAVAREKIRARNVEFVTADITQEWQFAKRRSGTITASLILEHVDDLGHIFREAAKALAPGGIFYICELHPFKQYMGSKARFENNGETAVPDCFVHNISDYLNTAKKAGFELERLDEWFDSRDRRTVPRLVSFLFRRSDFPICKEIS